LAAGLLLDVPDPARCVTIAAAAGFDAVGPLPRVAASAALPPHVQFCDAQKQSSICVPLEPGPFDFARLVDLYLFNRRRQGT